MRKYPKHSDIPPLSATDPEIYKFQIEHQEITNRLIAKWGWLLETSTEPLSGRVTAILLESQERWLTPEELKKENIYKQEYRCEFIDDNKYYE